MRQAAKDRWNSKPNLSSPGNNMSTPVETREHLHELLKSFDTAMVVTFAANGDMHARPMALAELSVDGDAYFVTSIDSPKVAEIRANSVVTLSFQSPRQFACITGHATVVQDQALVDRLWQDMWKLWFPAGQADPNIAMIKFEAQQGEYWDNAGVQGLKFLYRAAIAYAKGESPESNPQQHAKVQL